MLPKIWIIDTYSVMIILGVIACFCLFWSYRKKHNIEKQYTYDIFILACLSIIIGLLSAVLFQTLYDAIKGQIRGLAMTFYGGLVGGVISFALGYKIYIKKKYKEANFINDIFPIAPACITIAHAFGRIGCFMAGCCYGVETSSLLGVKFPKMEMAVHPTQLYEAVFLLVLTVVLFLLAIKKKNIYNFPIYLISYGVFRFLLEFLRGDERGFFFLSLSPSQWVSIIAVISGIIILVLLRKKYVK